MLSLKKLWKQPYFRFLVWFLVLYTGWNLVYDLYLHNNSAVDIWVINHSILSTEKLLSLMGYDTFIKESDAIRTVGIDGTHGLWVGDPCNGLVLFALYTCFIITFPGPVKHKLWAIPVGIILIHIVNIFRITGLCMIVLYAPEYLDLNHDYIFKTLVYLFIFLLWMIWVKRFSGISWGEVKKQNTDNTDATDIH